MHRKATPTDKTSENTIPGLFLTDKKLIWFILFLIHRQNIRACQCGVKWWFSGSNSARSCMKTNLYIHLIGIYISVTEWRNCLVNSDLTLTLWKFKAQKPRLNRQFFAINSTIKQEPNDQIYSQNFTLFTCHETFLFGDKNEIDRLRLNSDTQKPKDQILFSTFASLYPTPTDRGRPAAPGQEGTCGPGSPQIAPGQAPAPHRTQHHPAGCAGWAQKAATELQRHQISEKPHEKPPKMIWRGGSLSCPQLF